ncbi:helix-turn-helix domain-containing protein [Sedimentibacter sp. B4]
MKNNEKLAYFLYTNCAGDVVQYTHEQIALLTGMNRVSVTKLLNTFADEKLISQHYKEIKILNMKGLASIFNSIGYFID